MWTVSKSLVGANLIIINSRQLLKIIQQENTMPSFSVATSSAQNTIPEMKLFTFSRKYEDCMSFKETFPAIIDRNAELSDLQQYKYIRASSSNEVVTVIQSVVTTSDNYDTI